jgi:hypothetical protein
MIEKLHDHIVDELRLNTRTDTIFIITAILLNLVTLGVNAGVASAGNATLKNRAIIGVFMALVVVVNVVVIVGLSKGMQTRAKLLGGLLAMYDDQGVAKYYDRSILKSYASRYVLFIIAVVFTGATAIAVPLILMI